MAKKRKPPKCVWLSTKILDDDEIRALDGDKFRLLILAAFGGETNVFSKHIRFTKPSEEE